MLSRSNSGTETPPARTTFRCIATQTSPFEAKYRSPLSGLRPHYEGKLQGLPDGTGKSTIFRSEDGLYRDFDFAQLRTEVAAWQAQEAAKIRESGLESQDQRYALIKLLEKETQLLAALDRLRSRVYAEKKDGSIGNKLALKAKPEEWVIKGRGSALVYTAHSLRALEILSCYERLAQNPRSSEERKSVLEEAGLLLPGKGSKSEALKALLRRERDLMDRCLRKDVLIGLRKRICIAFADIMGDNIP